MVWRSDLVLRDREILSEIAQLYCSVAFSIDTTDDILASKLEPGAPLPSARFCAMETLAKHGIRTGVALMPVLPYLENSETNVMAVVRQEAESSARNINSATGYVMIALRPMRTS